MKFSKQVQGTPKWHKPILTTFALFNYVEKMPTNLILSFSLHEFRQQWNGFDVKHGNPNT